MKTSLPTDSAVRKTYPLFNGLFGYFGAALAEVAHHSWRSNEKHNPGQPLHWSVDKSNDHADCCARHLLDMGDFEAALNRHDALMPEGYGEATRAKLVADLLTEATANAWRSLALLQTLLVRHANAPLAFNARRSEPPPPDFPALEKSIDAYVQNAADVEEARAMLGIDNLTGNATNVPSGPTNGGCEKCPTEYCSC